MSGAVEGVALRKIIRDMLDGKAGARDAARQVLTTPPARSYVDGVGKVEQPLCNTVPDRIYLLDCGSGDISWCGDPDPDGANDDAVAIEYVRVGVWRKPVEPEEVA